MRSRGRSRRASAHRRIRSPQRTYSEILKVKLKAGPRLWKRQRKFTATFLAAPEAANSRVISANIVNVGSFFERVRNPDANKITYVYLRKLLRFACTFRLARGTLRCTANSRDRAPRDEFLAVKGSSLAGKGTEKHVMGAANSAARTLTL